MTKELLFWMVFIFALLFGGWYHFQNAQLNYYGAGLSLIEFILIGLLGWQVFGSAVK